VVIDFDGLDDLVTLPLEQSYGCRFEGIYVWPVLPSKGETRTSATELDSDLKQFLDCFDIAGSDEVAARDLRQTPCSDQERVACIPQ
jgi:hypothetical protein